MAVLDITGQVVVTKGYSPGKVVGMGRKATATVAYVLDPDLAVPSSLNLSLANRLGLKNKGVVKKIKSAHKIKTRGVATKERQDALDLVVDEIGKFIDLLRIGDISTLDEEAVKKHIEVRTEISQSDYTRLNKFGKQFYVNATNAMYDRYPVGSEYAGIVVPPPGRFTNLSAITTQDVKIKVRGFTSTTPKGTRNMLLRLTDSSLLELYTRDQSVSADDVTSTMDGIIGQEPEILKKYILSSGLTVDLGRPAYNLHTIVNIIRRNAGLQELSPETIEVETVIVPTDEVEIEPKPTDVQRPDSTLIRRMKRLKWRF